jgi:hypothetical protein
MPTYTPNIPQPGDIPAFSQDQILQNFQSIDDGTNGFACNHVSLTDSTLSQRGKHKYIQMPLQSPNGPATSTSEGAIYTKSGTGAQPQLFWRPQSTLANGNEVQMTGVIPLVSEPGYSFLPGGILMQWGIVTGPGSFTYSGLGLLNFSTAFVVLLSLRTGSLPTTSQGYSVGSFSTTGFTVSTFNLSGRDFHFISIGAI